MDLMNLLPDYYKGNKTMEELQEIITDKANELAENFNETIDQLLTQPQLYWTGMKRSMVSKLMCPSPMNLDASVSERR